MKLKNLSTILAENLGMLKGDVERIISTAPYRYKVYQIPKRKEGEFRTIAQPAFEVKIIQRWIVSNILSEVPVHISAAAYVKGKGIKANALAHAKNKYILKMDFSNFFPSIKYIDILKHLTPYLQDTFSDDDVNKICRLFVRKDKVTKQLELSIGAPSSPFISNSIMFTFDDYASNFCKEQGVTYTRYADDLTFSTKKENILKDVEIYVKGIVHKIKSPKLRVNNNKTIHASTNRKRVVTGLVLTPSGKVSLGRERKRDISLRIYRYTKGNLDDKETNKLRGLLAFALDVENEFIIKMRVKYGVDTIDSILKREF